MDSKQRTHEENRPQQMIITSLKITDKEKTLKAAKREKTSEEQSRRLRINANQRTRGQLNGETINLEFCTQ